MTPATKISGPHSLRQRSLSNIAYIKFNPLGTFLPRGFFFALNKALSTYKQIIKKNIKIPNEKTYNTLLII